MSRGEAEGARLGSDLSSRPLGDTMLIIPASANTPLVRNSMIQQEAKKLVFISSAGLLFGLLPQSRALIGQQGKPRFQHD